MPKAANPVAQDTNFACRKILGFLIKTLVLLFIANLVLLLRLFSTLKTMAIFVVLSSASNADSWASSLVFWTDRRQPDFKTFVFTLGGVQAHLW